MKNRGMIFQFLFWTVCSAAHAWTLVNPTGQGWTNHTIVIHWNFAVCNVAEAEMLTRLDQAIATWNATNGVDLKLSRSATESADTSATFIAGTAVDIPLVACDNTFATDNSVDADFIPAATRLSMANGPIDYGGILLNADSGAAADLGNISGDQIAVILAHELGHVFGLGHSSVPNALMYYSITSKTSPIITEDDLEGLSFLYPRHEFSGGMFGCSFVAPAGGASNAAGVLWSVGFIALTLGGALSLGRSPWLRRFSNQT